MKKENTINASPASVKVLLITLVTFTMFAVGYLVGYGLFYLFDSP